MLKITKALFPKGKGYVSKYRFSQQGTRQKDKTRTNQAMFDLLSGAEFSKPFVDSGVSGARLPLDAPNKALEKPLFTYGKKEFEHSDWKESVTEKNQNEIRKVLSRENYILNRMQFPTYCNTAEDIKRVNFNKEWTLNTKRTGIIGRKIGVGNYYHKVTGYKYAYTLIHIPDNHVLRYFRKEEYNGKMGCMVVGAGNAIAPYQNETYNEYCRSVGVPIKQVTRRFYCSEDAALLPGTRLHAGHLAVGNYVDVQAVSVNYGWQDFMSKWHGGGGPANNRGGFRRGSGSIGAEGHGGHLPKRKMAGLVGDVMIKVPCREVLRINYKDQVIYVSGRIPGRMNTWAYIQDYRVPLYKINHEKFNRNYPKPKNPTDFQYVFDDENFPGEAYSETLHNWQDPTISDLSIKL